MAAAMNPSADVLRIRISLSAQPVFCEWALIAPDGQSLPGKGLLTDLPQRCPRVEVVLPAAEVLITRMPLPATSRRHSAALLAYAVEEATAADPDSNDVSWLGTAANGMAVLAVVDKSALARWRAALGAAGIRDFDLYGETLLLPWTAGTWSLAWDGVEGFVRTGVAEGSVTDSGEHRTPPLSLQLLLGTASGSADAPTAINLYMTTVAPAPDVAAWSQALGVPVQLAGSWRWDRLSADAGPQLAQQGKRGVLLAGIVPRLRPALMLLGLALGVQALVTGVAWASLANEQQALRAQMEARFRAVFPDAVAVVDPVLQMRRQLATARQAAGTIDSGDFLPLVEQLATATAALPAGSVQVLSYESGRMTLELAGVGAQEAQLLLAQLRQAGLVADLVPAAADTQRLILTIRPT